MLFSPDYIPRNAPTHQLPPSAHLIVHAYATQQHITLQQALTPVHAVQARYTAQMYTTNAFFTPAAAETAAGLVLQLPKKKRHAGVTQPLAAFGPTTTTPHFTILNSTSPTATPATHTCLAKSMRAAATPSCDTASKSIWPIEVH
jgi:hypothetical protein